MEKKQYLRDSGWNFSSKLMKDTIPQIQISLKILKRIYEKNKIKHATPEHIRNWWNTKEIETLKTS